MEVRRLVLSRTSYDQGFVTISADTEGAAQVEWTPDPFRRPSPKRKPWKGKFKFGGDRAIELFRALDGCGFAKMADGRIQIPDEPSLILSETRSARPVHTVTYPAAEPPVKLSKVIALLDAIYVEAKLVATEP